MSRNLFRLFASVCLFVFASAPQIQAYTFSSSPATVWPNGNVSMILKLGSVGRTLTDGNTSWNTVAQQALSTWNTYLGTIQFTPTTQGVGAGSDGDHVNQVFFNSTIYGQSFGQYTLAVTTTWRTGTTTRQESDVVFNNAQSWDSYRGPLQQSSEDLLRVALHEFGHVLGLGHPDQAGQSVSAIMNSVVSGLDHLVSDDINGARALYPSQQPPPTITVQPQSQTVPAGANVTFSVVASSSPAPGYQWYWNDNPLPGANSPSLTFYNAQSSDAGSVKVLVSNSGGSVWSAIAVLTVNGAPSIATQPQSRIVTAGSGVTFGVIASGSAPLSYQWYFNDVPISGATVSSYSLAATQPDHTGAYKVRVSNPFGSVESSIAVLTVQNPPVNQAGNLLVNGGFESFDNPDSWFHLPNGSTAIPGWVSVDNDPGGQANNGYFRAPYYGHAASEGAHFIYIDNHSLASATLNGIYQDFATLPGAIYQVTFDTATEISYGTPGLIAVSAGDTVAHYEIPNVNAFPLPPSLPYNFSGWYNGSFTFTATGTVTRLQFFDEGAQIGYPFSQSQIGLAADGEYFYTIARNDPRIRKFDRTGKYLGDVGSLRDSLGLNTAQTGISKDGESFLTIAAGDYRIRRFDLSGNFISDVVGFHHAGVPDGNNTGVAVLQVPGAQTRLFSINQGDATVREWDGSNGAFWSNAVILTDINGPVSINSDIDFDGEYFYAIAPNGPFIWKFDSTGHFLDFISLSEGTGNPATGNASPLLDNVRVSPVPPVIASQPESQAVPVGSSVTFSVGASGFAPLSYQWFFNDAPINSANEPLLTLPNVQLGYAGRYHVVVSNPLGTVTSESANLLLTSTSLVVAVRPASQIAVVGSTVVIATEMLGPGPVSCQWWFKGRKLAGQTNASLSLPNIQFGARGDYQVELRNGASVVRSAPARVTVVIPPTIISQPRSTTAREGKPVTLRVTAKGSKPFTYQWFKDGIAVAQATNRFCTFTYVAPSDTGFYSVRVSNAGAYQDSIRANLSVAP